MKCYTNFFKCSGPADPAEKKAILFAVLACLLFIGFLNVVSRLTAPRRVRVNRVHVAQPPLPVKPVRVTPPQVAERLPDINSRFRVAPANFKGINFATRSYGNYQLSQGFSRDLVLIDGQFREFGESKHWFDLDDVLYTDLTGDGNPEAIVMMTHLQCGSKCDGGKSLIYVYSQNEPMQEILKYESGSGMEGCSLKSLTVTNRRLALELFGRCPQSAGATSEFVRRDTYDVTRVEFFFNGKQLVPKPSMYLTLPDRGEVNYGVEVRINDGRAAGYQF
ncbi:MAG TPA: hypothetical protein VJR02_27240 [Pyrinomonadaceae bacterium]|nr:hypothetical protein [Pyrinomonadaceae bacterium]